MQHSHCIIRSSMNRHSFSTTAHFYFVLFFYSFIPGTVQSTSSTSCAAVEPAFLPFKTEN